MEKAPEIEAEEDQDTSNDIYEMLNLYRKYEALDKEEYTSDHERSVEINLANPEFPIGIASASHQTEATDPETEQVSAVKASGICQPKDPQWNCYWDRELLLKNRDGKGLRQLTELTLKRYEGITEKLFDKFGSATLTSGVTYQGPFSEQRKATGIGRIRFPDGTIFDGEVQDGEIGSRGVYRWSDGSVYEGNIHKGVRHGFGRLLDATSASFYSGNWHYAHMHGYGKIFYYGNESNFYQGSWHTGTQWGHGIRQWPSGNFYEGQFACGMPHGCGSKLWMAQHVYYRGEFEEGLPHGYGLMVWLARQAPAMGATSQKFYYGTFTSGLIEGYGVFVDNDGCSYKGHWKAGKKHGKFTVTVASGIKVECFFVNDSMHDPIKKFLLKEAKEKFYIVPLPGPSIRQIDYAPYYDTEVSAIAMPGTVYFLSEKFGLSDDEVAAEIKGVSSVLTAYLEALTDVYNVYSHLMVETSCDNTYTLRAFQFWQFLVDVVVEKGNTGTDIQQGLYYVITAIESCFDIDGRRGVFCHPYLPIKPSEFLDRVTVAAYLIERQKQNAGISREIGLNANYSQRGMDDPTDWPFRKKWDIPGRPLKRLIEARMFEFAGQFNSCLFHDPGKCPIIFRYVSQLHRMYRYIFELYGGQQEIMPDALTIDTVVRSLQDAHIAGSTGLAHLELLKIIETNYPEIRDGNVSFALHVPITLLEYVELIINVSLAYRGDFKPMNNGQPFHGVKPTTFKGKIANAVDSLVLTAQKRPEMVGNGDKNMEQYDADFFAMLRGDAAVNTRMNCGDAVTDERDDERDSRIFIRNSRTTFGKTSQLPNRNNERVYMDVGGYSELTVHPPSDPTDYEYPDCSLPTGAHFLGFTLANPNVSLTASATYPAPAQSEKTDTTPSETWKPKLADVPSMDAYSTLVTDCSVTPLLPPPTLSSWENQVVPFLEHIFFPNMILLKRTNDLLIQHGHLRPLGDPEEPDCVLTDSMIEAILDGDGTQSTGIL